MRRTVLILFISACVVFGCAYYNTFYNAKKAYKEGERIRLSQQMPDGSLSPLAVASYELAIENAGLVLRDHPGSSLVDDALVLIGDALAVQGRHEEAVKRYQQALRLFPDSEYAGHCVFSLGSSLIDAGDSTRADDLLGRFVREYPDDERIPDAILLRGRISFGGARYEEAVSRLQVLLDRQPGHDLEAEAEYYIARSKLELEQFAEAREHLERVMGLTRTNRLRYQAGFMLGESLRREGSLSAALEEFESLLDQRAYRDYHPEVMLAMAACLAELGRNEATVSRYETLISLYEADRKHDEEVSRAMYELGELYRSAGDLALAEKWYGDARRKSPRLFWVTDEAEKKNRAIGELRRVNGNLGNMLAALESIEPAMDPESESTSNYARLVENVTGLRYQLAELYLFQLEMADSALSQYRAIEDETADPSSAAKAAYAQAWVFAEVLKDTERARSVYDAITARYPGTAHAVEASIVLLRPVEGELPQDRLFAEAERLLFEADQPDSARGLYELVILRYPEGEYAPRALYALGWLAETRYDDPETALGHFTEIVERYPRSEQAESVRDKVQLMEALRSAADRATETDSAADRAAEQGSGADPAAETDSAADPDK